MPAPKIPITKKIYSIGELMNSETAISKRQVNCHGRKKLSKSTVRKIVILFKTLCAISFEIQLIPRLVFVAQKTPLDIQF